VGLSTSITARRDVELLAEIAQTSAPAHAPFITAAAPSLLQIGIRGRAEQRDARSLRPHPPPATPGAERTLAVTIWSVGLPPVLALAALCAKTVPVEEFDSWNEETEREPGTTSTRGPMRRSSDGGGASSRSVQGVRVVARAFAAIEVSAGRGGKGCLATRSRRRTRASTDEVSDEIAISDTARAELAKSGMMPLSHKQESDIAAFHRAQRCTSRNGVRDPGCHRQRQPGARLPYLFSCCRFAHYLKCNRFRDKIGSFKERRGHAAMAVGLDHAIPSTVTRRTPARRSRRRKPLSAAEVVGGGESRESGRYTPRFLRAAALSVGGLTVSLRLRVEGSLGEERLTRVASTDVRATRTEKTTRGLVSYGR